MKLSLHQRQDSLLIHSCVLGPLENNNESNHKGEGYRIRIADTWYEQSLIVTPQAVELWEAGDVSALSKADFQRLANFNTEVIILGVGKPEAFKQHGFPPPAITQPLMHKRIGLEVMDTSAACRTYNILVDDGRKAVAALIV